ncbi:MAG: YggU family protein [Thermodesulfobacteriales bacterium]|nr:MAG: YggU family protein [Thermodesulfobacteriales bacterium]
MSKSYTILKIQIQPKSYRNQIVGLHDGRLKIKIAAPPVDGKANESLIEFLAKTFKISKSNIEILKGHTSKLKTIKLSGISENTYSSIISKYEYS